MILLLVLQLLFGGNLTEKENVVQMSDRQKQVKAFLNNISQIESSGGTNFEHPTLTSGIHKGHQAIGRYGLMPNTVSEVINRMRITGTLTPELSELKDLDPVSLKTKLEANPALEDQIAESLAGRVLERQGDEEKAAFSWHKGHNLKPEQITEKPYQDDEYVKKYNSYKKLITGEGDEQR